MEALNMLNIDEAHEYKKVDLILSSMKKIDSAPSLRTVNGTGSTMSSSFLPLIPEKGIYIGARIYKAAYVAPCIADYYVVKLNENGSFSFFGRLEAEDLSKALGSAEFNQYRAKALGSSVKDGFFQLFIVFGIMFGLALFMAMLRTR